MHLLLSVVPSRERPAKLSKGLCFKSTPAKADLAAAGVLLRFYQSQAAGEPDSEDGSETGSEAEALDEDPEEEGSEELAGAFTKTVQVAV